MMGAVKSIARKSRALVLLPGLALAMSCTQEGDTLVVNGLDCGLVRSDLSGNWAVTYTGDSATLLNCDDPSKNGLTVDVIGTTFVYDAFAYASPSGASFNAVAAGPNLPDELLASVEADSCLALVQTWEEDDQGWVQCLGTLDRTTRLIGGVCDSIDLDTNGDGVPEVACDLSHSFRASIGTP